MPRLRRLLFVAIALPLSSCQLGTDDRDREECARLVDHLVDIQLDGEVPREAQRAAEREKHRAILRHAIHDRVVADCLNRPAAHTECALEAKTSGELKECE